MTRRAFLACCAGLLGGVVHRAVGYEPVKLSAITEPQTLIASPGFVRVHQLDDRTFSALNLPHEQPEQWSYDNSTGMWVWTPAKAAA